MRVFLGLLAVLSIAVLLLAAMRKPDAPRPEPHPVLQVSATIFPLADWLREVGGPDVAVHCLISGAANSHQFEPAPNDAVTVSRSRALFAVGLGLDEWAERMAQNSGRGEQLAFFETGTWIAPRQMSATEKDGGHHAGDGHHHEGNLDPHYWLDPARARAVVLRMASELGRLDPPRRDAYQARAEACVKKLDELDAEIKGLAQRIPAGAQIVTFHDAYGYLLERLNVKLAAVIQISPGVEPAIRDVTEAVRIMRRIKQRVVFQEPQESARAAQLVAQELRVPVAVLDPMDSEASTTGKTYPDRLRHDILAIGQAVTKH